MIFKPYPEKMKRKLNSYKPFHSIFWIVFDKMSRLINFALALPYLSMFKICGIIGISKIMLFNFFGTDRIKQNQKNQKPLKTIYVFQATAFQAMSIKAKHFFWFFTQILTLSVPVACCPGHNTDLISNSNISKTARYPFLKSIQ